MENVVATGLSWLVTIGAVATAVGYAVKYLNVAAQVGELAATVAEAAKDGKFDPDEIKAIVKEAKDIPAAIKAISSKG